MKLDILLAEWLKANNLEALYMDACAILKGYEFTTHLLHYPEGHSRVVFTLLLKVHGRKAIEIFDRIHMEGGGWYDLEERTDQFVLSMTYV